MHVKLDTSDFDQLTGDSRALQSEREETVYIFLSVLTNGGCTGEFNVDSLFTLSIIACYQGCKKYPKIILSDDLLRNDSNAPI